MRTSPEKFSLAAIALMAAACVGEPPAAPPSGGNNASVADAGARSDSAMSDDATSEDSGVPDDVGRDAGPDMRPAEVATFEVSQEVFRIGFDAFDVGGSFIVKDAEGNDVECPGGVQAEAIVGFALESGRVSGKQFLFVAEQPGRSVARYKCQNLRAEVEVFVLPAPHAETLELVAWLRPDIGTTAPSNDLTSIRNIVDDSEYDSAGGNPRLVTNLPQPAIRFTGSERLQANTSVSIDAGHVILVYRSNAEPERVQPIIGEPAGSGIRNDILIPAGDFVTALRTDNYGDPEVSYDWNADGVNVLSRHIYHYDLDLSTSLAVALGIDQNSYSNTVRATSLAGENLFYIDQIGGGSEGGAVGDLFEVIVLTDQISATGLDAIVDYLSRRYP